MKEIARITRLSLNVRQMFTCTCKVKFEVKVKVVNETENLCTLFSPMKYEPTVVTFYVKIYKSSHIPKFLRRTYC